MIELKNIDVTFQQSGKTVEAVKQVNITIEDGDIYGIIGYSGAGKSTLVRTINLLQRPTNGTVTVSGVELTSLKEAQLRDARKKIGMIFQHFNLMNTLSVFDNVAFPLKRSGLSKAEIKEKVESLLHLVGLEDKITSYPRQLSGGQKQRVAIARALANDPDVLLCDEATSALDPKTTKDILNLLVEINKRLGLTIVLITHEMHVVRQICHRVAVMEQGRVVETGEVLDVFKNPQQTITKQFVGEERSEQDLHDVFEHLSTSLRPGVAVRIQYLGDTTAEGILSEVIRKLDVSISILQAHVNVTQKGVLGSMIILIEEESAKAEEVIDFLRKAEIIVEVLENV